MTKSQTFHIFKKLFFGTYIRKCSLLCPLGVKVDYLETLESDFDPTILNTNGLESLRKPNILKLYKIQFSIFNWKN